MPICTFCTRPTRYLYTVYESEHNLRLEQCTACYEFVDPYVEHDSITLLLDLILLKRGVYRHLLFNRGAEPRRAVGKRAQDPQGPGEKTEESLAGKQRKSDWVSILQLGTALVAVDAYPAHAPEATPWTKEIALSFGRVFLGTAAETVAFHGGIVLSCFLVMELSDFLQRCLKRASKTQSNIRQEFRLSLISLSLFYSSLTKLFLLFLLTIWLPTSQTSSSHSNNPVPTWVNHLHRDDNFIAGILELLDDDKLDREWIVRNVLGGMSAGFGLRVILDIHPLFTTLIILSGWASKNAVATLISGWVGGDARSGAAWLAYSIP
ncbi:hypothetical protein NLJ89_g769 [Agrocybe chaxingu]|uniref:Protein ARV n=1 Tax=Agrocybe chaxingu TaxID=84603 RepID=A0A9W8N1B7_9AGAR|nr:hypothetical protein NLJ89_g769 [Agrocybe chaxingu]